MAVKVVQIPLGAKVELDMAVAQLNILAKGIALGMGLQGNWTFDAKQMAFLVEEPEEPNAETPKT